MRGLIKFGLFLTVAFVVGEFNRCDADSTSSASAVRPKDGNVCHIPSDPSNAVWYVGMDGNGENILIRADQDAAASRIMTLTQQAQSLEHSFYTGIITNPKTMHPIVVAAFYTHGKWAMMDFYPGDEAFDPSYTGNFREGFFTNGPVLLECCPEASIPTGN